MITNLFIDTAVLFIQGVFQFLPVVTLASLPIIGDSIRSILISVVSTWNGVLVTFPYFIVVWNIFRFVILPFEGLMLLGKFILGSRSPSHQTD